MDRSGLRLGSLGLLAGMVFSCGIASSITVQAASHPSPTTGALEVPSQAADASESPYLAQNSAAMTRMMNGMAAKPTGDVDRDFVAMMTPHHQGAIDMAQAYLRYGHNEQLRRIAQEIIVDQLQEITAMRLALGESPPPSIAAPTQPDNPEQRDPMSKSPRTMQMK